MISRKIVAYRRAVSTRIFLTGVHHPLAATGFQPKSSGITEPTAVGIDAIIYSPDDVLLNDRGLGIDVHDVGVVHG